LKCNFHDQINSGIQENSHFLAVNYKNMKILDTLILFGSIGFLVIWVDQFIYKSVPFSDTYFWLMLGLGGLMLAMYRRGIQKLKDNQGKKK
jgi:hypothetical protein